MGRRSLLRQQPGVRERIGAWLTALLQFLNYDPGIGRLVVVETLGAGAAALERRLRVLAQVIAGRRSPHDARGRAEPIEVIRQMPPRRRQGSGDNPALRASWGEALVLAIQQGGGIMGFLIGSLALASGAVFSVAMLFASVRLLSDGSPLTYSLRAMWGALLHGQGPAELVGNLGVLLLYGAVLLPLSMLVLAACFRFARARGTLARF